MLPVGSNKYYRRYWTVFRLVNSGWDGKSANYLKVLLEDIFNGITHGMKCVNPICGQYVMIIYLLVLLAKFPALVPLKDEIVHSAFSSLCVLPRSKDSVETTIFHTSKFHLLHISLLKSDARLNNL